jgi:hypothetical protein
VNVKSANGSQGCATAFDVIPATRKNTMTRIVFLIWGGMRRWTMDEIKQIFIKRKYLKMNNTKLSVHRPSQ